MDFSLLGYQLIQCNELTGISPFTDAAELTWTPFTLFSFFGKCSCQVLLSIINRKESLIFKMLKTFVPSQTHEMSCSQNLTHTLSYRQHAPLCARTCPMGHSPGRLNPFHPHNAPPSSPPAAASLHPR